MQSVGGAVFPCGRPSNSNNLTGPGILSPVDIPWSVAITVRSEFTTDATFSAVLISPSLVLASAHCKFKLIKIKIKYLMLNNNSDN